MLLVLEVGVQIPLDGGILPPLLVTSLPSCSLNNLQSYTAIEAFCRSVEDLVDRHEGPESDYELSYEIELHRDKNNKSTFTRSLHRSSTGLLGIYTTLNKPSFGLQKMTAHRIDRLDYYYLPRLRSYLEMDLHWPVCPI